MPASADRPAARLLVDTSVAIALTMADHEAHLPARSAVSGRTLGLSGHAVFETFSVLTRLPPPARLKPASALRLLASRFPSSCHLSGSAAEELLAGLANRDIAGGSVYDALVGATAVEHGLPLATRDRRALDTYAAVGVEVEWIS